MNNKGTSQRLAKTCHTCQQPDRLSQASAWPRRATPANNPTRLLTRPNYAEKTELKKEKKDDRREILRRKKLQTNLLEV